MKQSLLLSLLCISSLATSQTVVWRDKPEAEMDIAGGRRLYPNRYRTVELNNAAMLERLTMAPDESDVFPSRSTMILECPAPDGRMDSFRLVEYSMMEQGLANRYPSFGTYRGVHIHDPFKTIRCDWTSRGFSGMVTSADGRYFIEPFARKNLADFIVFYKHDYPAPDSPFICETESASIKEAHVQARVSGDCTFRTYRLAIATTGQYSNYFGADSESEEDIVLSEVVVAVNRLNEVYEKDVTVRMLLIENTTEVFYYNPNTDPFSGSVCTQRGQNQNNMDDVIGSANYDVGHLFGNGTNNGCATLNAICSSSTKAYGVSQHNVPENDPYVIDYVAHELGHQFGGNHTQNNSCNRNNPTAMEPGSASTIMGYAGICNPNVQNNSDAYFHGINVQEINNHISSGGGNNCDVPIAWENTAPVISSGSDYVIPRSTPFMLTASATDANGDPLTYCWEQWDQEVGSMPPSSTNTAGPMFRSLDPDPSPTRYFPRLQDLVNNIDPTWEVLPSVTRNMEFRVTVRDFHEGLAGCTDEDNINVNTTSTAGPFLVTSPNTSSDDWNEGGTETVTWNVANTTSSPVNCANVNIYLSYDGGFTYPLTLASNVPNDGSQTVTVPVGLSSTARVMVKGANHIFFDISNQNFDITCSLTVTTNADSGNGSLRDVLNCATPGDTIKFAPQLNGQSINLLSPISLSENVIIYATQAQNISLNGILTTSTLIIEPSVTATIAGLDIIGGTGITGCAIFNEGSLTLSNASVSIGGVCAKSLIANYGALNTEGNCEVD